MTKSFDIVGLGLCVIDLVGLGQVYPDEDSKVELDECDWQAGGSAATGLVAGRRLGATATFMGQLGLDYFGQRILESLKQECIDTSFVHVYHDMLSQYAFSYTSRDTGSRTMFVNFNKHWNSYKLDDGAREQVRNCQALVVDRHECTAGIEAMQIARSKGIPSVFDPSTKVDERVVEVLEYATYPIVPIKFIEKFSNEIDVVRGARKVLQLGCEAIVVTSGSKGSLLVTRKHDRFFPAFEVEVVDSLGAGDVFHGAFAYGIVQKWSLDKICIFANAVAAIKCKHLGGRRGIPTMKQVRGFLRHRGYDFV